MSFLFLVVASLSSLQIVAKQDTPHTTHYFFFFFYFSWLLFSLSETWKKIIVGWQNDCSTWKFGMEKDTLSIPFNNNVLKLEKSDIWRGKYWVLWRLIIFWGVHLFSFAEGVQFYWTLSDNSLLHCFKFFLLKWIQRNS